MRRRSFPLPPVYPRYVSLMIQVATLALSVSVSDYICLSLSLSAYLCLSLSDYLWQFQSFSVSLSLRVCRSMSLSLPDFLSLFFCLSACLSACVSLSVSVSFCISFSVSLSLCPYECTCVIQVGGSVCHTSACSISDITYAPTGVGEQVYIFLHQLLSNRTSIHSFLFHSYRTFIQRLVRKPIQRRSQLQKIVFIGEKRTQVIGSIGKMRSSKEKPFQVEGFTTENARFCLLELLAKGTRRGTCWDEQRDHSTRGEDNRAHEGRQEQGQVSSARPRKRSPLKK